MRIKETTKQKIKEKLAYFKPTPAKVIIAVLLTIITYFIVRFPFILSDGSIGRFFSEIFNIINLGYQATLGGREQAVLSNIYVQSVFFFLFWYLIVCLVVLVFDFIRGRITRY